MNNRASLQLGGGNWAAKDANLLAYKTSLSEKNFLPIEFTFERGANLAATRVNSSGLIEKGRENLLTQSNQFDTTWVMSNTSVTSGQSGYDGSSDAWLLSKSAASGRIYQNTSVSDVATYSVYAKAGSTDWIYIIGSAGIYPEAYFDLLNGVVGNTSSNPSFIGANIEDVGDGWYRCSITFNSSLTRMWIYPADGNGDTSGTSGNIYIQDAQLEQGLVATDYIETGASTAQAGVLEDLPRINYSGSTPSLLLEPSRTNLIDHSEYLGEELTGNRMAINDVVDTSPEGVLNASKLVPDTTPNQTHQSDTNNYGSFVSGDKITISMFAKADGFDGIILRFKDTSGAFTTNRIAIFDLNRGRWTNHSMDGTTGVMTGEVGMEDYGNGWYRCFATATADASGDVDIRIPVVDVTAQDTYDETFTGDNTSGVLIYGLQVEEGSYPTSYIPTYGTAATRGAEGQNYSGFSSLIGQTEGTLFLEIDGAKPNTEIFSLNRSTLNSIFVDINSGLYRIFTWADGTTNSQPTSIANTDRIKIAIAYKSNDFAIYANGSQVLINNSLTWTPNVTIDSLNFNVGGYVTGQGVAKYKQVMLFKTRLSNAELATLTTL